MTGVNVFTDIDLVCGHHLAVYFARGAGTRLHWYSCMMSRPTAHLIITFLLSTVPTPALRAQVNVKDGSFFQTHTDISISDFEISRSYNSRSLFDGVFGLGWCSPLDWKIDVSVPNRITWYDCKTHRTVAFFKIPSASSKEKILFAAPVYATAKIEWRDKSFYMSLPPYTLQFNEHGHLASVQTPKQNLQVITGRDGQIISLKEKNQEVLFAKYDDNHVEWLRTPQEGQFKYAYTSDQLINVDRITASGSERQFQYDYDDRKNLVAAVHRGVAGFKARYNGQNDWVTAVQTEKGCIESYDYSTTQSENELRTETRALQTCPEQKPKAKRFIFNYEINSLQQKRLKTSEVVSDVQTLRFRFDPITGNPITEKTTDQIGKDNQ